MGTLEKVELTMNLLSKTLSQSNESIQDPNTRKN